MELLYQRLGCHSMMVDLADLETEDMLQYDPYEDEL